MLEYHSVLWVNNIPIVQIHHILFTYSSVGLFPALAIVISAAMNTGVQASVFIPFWYIHRCEIAECYGNAMLSFLRNWCFSQ